LKVTCSTNENAQPLTTPICNVENRL